MSYISDKCSESTGKTSRCSDAVIDKTSATNPTDYKSNCDSFKKAVYKFTDSQGSPYGARLALYPTDVTTPGGTVKMNIVQTFYEELCSLTIGVNRDRTHCPGCTGAQGCTRQWVFGDDQSSDTDKAKIEIG